MSDLHHLPLAGHDMEFAPIVRAKVYRTSSKHWWWSYTAHSENRLIHGPFDTQPEAYASARRMVEVL